MAKAGLPRQYDVGGPSQPTGRLQGKKQKIIIRGIIIVKHPAHNNIGGLHGTLQTYLQTDGLKGSTCNSGKAAQCMGIEKSRVLPLQATWTWTLMGFGKERCMDRHDR